jgi:hypothetical protein
MSINFTLAEMQKALEFWGFNLWYDEKRREWELFSSESEYSLVGEIKEEIIKRAFYHLS